MKPRNSTPPAKPAPTPLAQRNAAAAAVAQGKPSPAGTPSWMTKGINRIQKQNEQQKAEAMTNSAPEFWLQDGETKQIRFTTNEPLFSMFRYSLEVKGKFRSFTQPAPEDPDPFAEAGLFAGLKMVYEIIDCTGYIDKKAGNKRVKNQRRFYLLNSKLFENLTRILKKRGNITNFNIEVTRSGSGTSTTYTLIPEENSPAPKPLTPEPLALKAAQYYAPIPTERARQLLGNRAAEESAE